MISKNYTYVPRLYSEIHGLTLCLLFSIFIPRHLNAQIRSDGTSASSFTLTLQQRDTANLIRVRTQLFSHESMAIVVVDMWDKHWCKTRSKQIDQRIASMNNTLEAARKLGIQIIFAPSGVTGYYNKSSHRQRIKNIAPVSFPQAKATFAPFPQDSNDGCKCNEAMRCTPNKVWRHQHDGLLIMDQDLISDRVEEIHRYCEQKGIKTLLYMGGVSSSRSVISNYPFSVMPMLGLGYECIIVRNLTEGFYSPPGSPTRFTTTSGDTLKATIALPTLVLFEKTIAPTITGDQLLIAAGMEDQIIQVDSPLSYKFSTEYVRNYIPKGASGAFRQLCYDYNWTGRSLSDLALKFTKADPAAYASLSKQANMDAVLVLAVPHHGYTTYASEYGTPFPALQSDWFGEVVDELHKRDIRAIGYITLGTNWKYMRDHIGLPFIHASMETDGQIGSRGLCFNAPGYLDLVANYSQELLRHYPVDAIRYDMLFSPQGCLCNGCKDYYKELYHEDLSSWEEIRKGPDSARYQLFNIATLSRAARRTSEACREIKPSIEIWQNHLNTDMEADLNTGRLFDLAYIEYGSPFRLLSLRGILDKKAIIVGQTLKSNIRRLVMALGARCYQYINVNQETALPHGDERTWVENDLAGFFKMVKDVQPYLENATLPSDIGIVFSENTRYHLPNFNRSPYMAICEAITNSYLDDSAPLQFINALDLDTKPLDQYRMLLLPRTSGLSDNELDVLKKYVQNGGNLVVLGDALLYDEQGKPLDNFRLSDEIGVDLISRELIADSLRISRDYIIPKGKASKIIADNLPTVNQLGGLTAVKAKKGRTLLWLKHNQGKNPLVHLNTVEKGKIMYIASYHAVDLLRSATQNQFGDLPLTVSPKGNQVILTKQEDQNRYVLHLISDGDYTIRIEKKLARFSNVTSKYPRDENWNFTVKDSGTSMIINVSGNVKDRVLVLE